MLPSAKLRTLASLLICVAAVSEFRPMGLSTVRGEVAAGGGKEAAGRKPHIVHIVADDLGWKDVGFHGADIQTPNIDELARTGARLEQFYAQPMCTPTRACLMTGRYPFRYGLQTSVIPASRDYGLATDEWLLPQALKDAGYWTAIIGKWHLGHGDRKYWPRQRGFDYYHGCLTGEIDYFTHEQHHKVDWYRDNEQINEKGYSTTLLGDDAVRIINNHDPATPLYLYLAFNAPHTPYQAPAAFQDRYGHIKDASRRAYAASITAMDDQIGHVLEALARKKMRGRTLILFHSDNGGTRKKVFAGDSDVSKIAIPCDNGPYRDGKGTLYEGGTRVVALASWPGRIRAGSIVSGMVHVVDLYPTLLKLAGGRFGKNKPLDGLDVWPTLSAGKSSPRREIVYNVEPFQAGIRQGDWKLIWRTPLPPSVELYNIATDPSEKNNVAAQHPETVAILQKRATDLAATMARPLHLEASLGPILQRLAMPASFAAETDP